jgi:hypothetical protein
VVAVSFLYSVLQVNVFKAKAEVEVHTELDGHAVQAVADEVLNPLLQTTEAKTKPESEVHEAASVGQVVQVVAVSFLYPVLHVKVSKAKAVVEVQAELVGQAIHEVAVSFLNPLLQTTEAKEAVPECPAILPVHD